MFQRIMVPVDLAHAERLDKATRTAADLAGLYSAEICYVGITTSVPSSVAHTPEEYGAKLSDFADAQGREHGHKTSSRALRSHDPTIDLDDRLIEAVEEVGADLVIMATHVPGLKEYIWASHGGKLAAHSKASVLLVRGG